MAVAVVAVAVVAIPPVPEFPPPPVAAAVAFSLPDAPRAAVPVDEFLVVLAMLVLAACWRKRG